MFPPFFAFPLAIQSRECFTRPRFLELVDQWSKAEMARQFLAALESKEQPAGIAFDGRAPADWLAWVHEWLDVFDPLNRKPEAIYEELAEVNPWIYRAKSDF